jgi:integrase
LFTTAVNDWQWLEDSPIRKVKKPKESRGRVRFLDDAERERFLAACRESSNAWLYPCVILALSTGMRQGELAALTFDDIDFSKRLITIHKSFNGPTKSGIVRHVPILDPILLPLKEWKLRCPTRLVFPNKKFEMQRPSGRIFQEVLHRVLIRAGLERRINSGSKRKWYITFHDLRHTFASHWAMSSGDMFRLKEILGHKDIQTTMRYSHLSPDAFSSDYSRLGNQGLLEEAKILTFQA